MSLREVVEQYLRARPEWREHEANRRTYLQWEDLTASPGQKFLATDLAAVRQMAREALAEAGD